MKPGAMKLSADEQTGQQIRNLISEINKYIKQDRGAQGQAPYTNEQFYKLQKELNLAGADFVERLNAYLTDLKALNMPQDLIDHKLTPMFNIDGIVETFANNYFPDYKGKFGLNGIIKRALKEDDRSQNDQIKIMQEWINQVQSGTAFVEIPDIKDLIEKGNKKGIKYDLKVPALSRPSEEQAVVIPAIADAHEDINISVEEAVANKPQPNIILDTVALADYEDLNQTEYRDALKQYQTSEQQLTEAKTKLAVLNDDHESQEKSHYLTETYNPLVQVFNTNLQALDGRPAAAAPPPPGA
jgi:beta-phosphoglucomutase-like phosphatase (HAD superfamily)